MGNTIEIVPIVLHLDAHRGERVRPTRQRRRFLRGARRGVGSVYLRAFARGERGCREPAARQPDNRDFTAREPLAHQRSFIVESATNAQRIPMIQNRTTTCDSGHPFISK